MIEKTWHTWNFILHSLQQGIPVMLLYVLHSKGMFTQQMQDAGVVKPDHAYPTLMNLLPAGLKGVAFA